MKILSKAISIQSLVPSSSTKEVSESDKFTNKEVNTQEAKSIAHDPKIKTVLQYKNFYEFKLPNGLKVFYKHSKGKEAKAKLVINSGAAKDPKGKEGLAHMLEHLVLNGTKSFGDHADKVFAFNGSSLNASTSPTDTFYPAELSNDKIELIFKYLSDILGGVSFDDETLKQEKSIIKSEKVTITESPLRKLSYKILKAINGEAHPMSADIIGSDKSLNDIGQNDLKEFHENEYVPNNATLILSANHDPEFIKSLLLKYFASFEPNSNIKELDLSPKANTEKNLVLKDKSFTNLSSLYFRVNDFKYDDLKLFNLLRSSLMSRGKRLHKRLVDPVTKEVKSLNSISFDHQALDKNNVTINLRFNFNIDATDTDRKKAQQIFKEEIQKVIAEGLAQADIQEAVDDFENFEIYKQDFQHADLEAGKRLLDLGEKDWRKNFDMVNDLKQVSSDDIKNYAAKYLNKEADHQINVYGEGSQVDKDLLNALNNEVPKQVLKKSNIKLDAKELQKLKDLSGKSAKTKVSIGKLNKFEHDGFSVSHNQNKELPIGHASLIFGEGIMSLTKEEKDMLALALGFLERAGYYDVENQKYIDDNKVANLKDQYGLSSSVRLDVNGGPCSYNFSVLSKNYDKSIDLLKNLLLNPAFQYLDKPEVKKRMIANFAEQKKIVINNLKEQKEKSTALDVGLKIKRLIFPKEHPRYENNLDHAIQTLENASFEQVLSLAKKIMDTTNKAKLVVSGDISEDQIKNDLVPMFKAAKSPQAKLIKNPKDVFIASPKKQIIIPAKNNEPKSQVTIVNTHDIEIGSDDLLPMQFANFILGGSGLSSRLFKNIRDKQGLVYAIGSANLPGPSNSMFNVGILADPRLAKKCLTETLKQLDEFIQEGISAEELEWAKNHYKQSTVKDLLNSRSSTHAFLTQLIKDGKDESHINNYIDRVDAITVEDVNQAIKKMIRPENFITAITKPKDYKESSTAKKAA